MFEIGESFSVIRREPLPEQSLPAADFEQVAAGGVSTQQGDAGVEARLLERRFEAFPPAAGILVIPAVRAPAKDCASKPGLHREKPFHETGRPRRMGFKGWARRRSRIADYFPAAVFLLFDSR